MGHGDTVAVGDVNVLGRHGHVHSLKYDRNDGSCVCCCAYYVASTPFPSSCRDVLPAEQAGDTPVALALHCAV